MVFFGTPNIIHDPHPNWKIQVLIYIFKHWHMDVSENNGTPKWMVYNGKPYWNGMIWGENPLFSETSKCLIVVKPTVTNPTHSVEWATLKTIIFTIHFGGNFPILGNSHIEPTRIGRYISRRLILFFMAKKSRPWMPNPILVRKSAKAAW